MGMLLAESGVGLLDPLDLLEEIAGARDWPGTRVADDEYVMESPRRWCTFRLHFIWQKDLGALHLHCGIDIRIPAGKRRDVNDLLATVNERLWLGHFEIGKENSTPTFRHTLLSRGQFAPSVEQLEDVIEIALEESDRYYPAFQFILWAGRGAEEALSAALIETIGEA